ncbi:uncharacterized protein Z520_03703 [Fonsecaea multimorphosa CBS 102226]|uniref:FAD/NAD(P)-binding domain-containing protein n=1 Tax=Fonsecaea multimorphosa CBS 102226 TaxID=1442371 RepID=A0A0D2IVE9_9EURO|nr:uncharacterized protein Z520_03703 [Fonsecaea multimorphosa CBS 102226]KIY01037.1 hypothetical protein Z520_03703 [Fonsecaea multimorphosa CBS 102226]OAL27621.1 hypothetical protein AYO22_03525 [Fonsecaea multimorphosa]
MAITVAVVGMGALGLMAMKNLKEDGFEVTGFEKRNWVGGVWKQSYDSTLSVTERTVFNSSRFRAAIPDYPFPDSVDDFPTAKQIWEYLESYCDHFGLRPHVRLNTEVKTFTRTRGKWAVEYVQDDGSSHTDFFDKLIISPGSFVVPRSPKLKDIDKFEGDVLHAIKFPHPSRFQGQNVLLIGLHATTQDLVVELAQHAKKVYIAHRNGLLLIPRYTADGKTYDQSQTMTLMFLQVFLERWFPRLWTWFIDWAFAAMSKQAYPNQRKEWNLTPALSLAISTPLVADAIYPHLESGFAEPVAAVQEILGPSAVRLTDGRVLDDIGSIIYATGYESAVPYAPKEYNPYPVADEAPVLYRNIFPLHEDPDVRNSLAFLGQGGFPFPGFVVFELATMAVSQIWLGRSHLPPLAEMRAWHRAHLAWRQSQVRRYYPSAIQRNFYAIFMPAHDQLHWLDRTAGTGMFAHFSPFSWRAWRFWWSCDDRDFYRLCKSGLLSPALWRLFDMGRRKPWAGAKQQIIEDNRFVESRRQERLRALEKLGSSGTST